MHRKAQMHLAYTLGFYFLFSNLHTCVGSHVHSMSALVTVVIVLYNSDDISIFFYLYCKTQWNVFHKPILVVCPSAESTDEMPHSISFQSSLVSCSGRFSFPLTVVAYRPVLRAIAYLSYIRCTFASIFAFTTNIVAFEPL